MAAKSTRGSCHGFLHADGYAGFNALYAQDPNTGHARMVEVAYWAHARRHLFDAHVETKSPLALEALERIARVFAVETEICGKPPEVRLAIRQERSVAELAALERFFEATLGQISGKSTLAKAIRCALSRWAALTRFTADGRLEMTNNAAERAIRPLILGRKNWLFAGSDSGGERAALLYTVIETCLCRVRHKADYAAR